MTDVHHSPEEDGSVDDRPPARSSDGRPCGTTGTWTRRTINGLSLFVGGHADDGRPVPGPFHRTVSLSGSLDDLARFGTVSVLRPAGTGSPCRTPTR